MRTKILPTFVRRMMLVSAVAVLSGAALAQQQPPQGPPQQRRGPDLVRPAPIGRGGPLTDEERQIVLAWAKERMPSLHQLILQRPRPGPFMRIGAQRYNALNQVAKDTEAYDRILKNIKNEDEIFKSVLELEKAKPEDKPAIREKIRSQMRDVFEDYLTQRQERIEALKDRLANEEEQLAKDKAEIDNRIADQLDRYGVEMAGATGPTGATTRESIDQPKARRGDTMAAPVDKGR